MLKRIINKIVEETSSGETSGDVNGGQGDLGVAPNIVLGVVDTINKSKDQRKNKIKKFRNLRDDI